MRIVPRGRMPALRNERFVERILAFVLRNTAAEDPSVGQASLPISIDDIRRVIGECEK